MSGPMPIGCPSTRKRAPCRVEPISGVAGASHAAGSVILTSWSPCRIGTHLRCIRRRVILEPCRMRHSKTLRSGPSSVPLSPDFRQLRFSMWWAELTKLSGTSVGTKEWLGFSATLKVGHRFSFTDTLSLTDLILTETFSTQDKSSTGSSSGFLCPDEWSDWYDTPPLPGDPRCPAKLQDSV
jgi:hypothetical protein